MNQMLIGLETKDYFCSNYITFDTTRTRIQLIY